MSDGPGPMPIEIPPLPCSISSVVANEILRYLPLKIMECFSEAMLATNEALLHLLWSEYNRSRMGCWCWYWYTFWALGGQL